MHDSAFRIGELVMRAYCDLPNAKILEVGSLNVNGCLRDIALPTTHYVGLDLEKGPSVDLVITPGEPFPVEDGEFDLVMASSVFEHDARFWDTFVRMCRAARPGGHIYVNAPSNGTVHRYPMDCWRFYPDAGLALVEHARSEGLDIDLVESFIANRHSDVWNDFVAVFRKGPSPDPLNTAFVYLRYPSLNARTWQSRAVYNESDHTEDMTLISEMRDRLTKLAEADHDRMAAENLLLSDRIAALEHDLDQRQAEVAQARSVLAEETAQRGTLASEMARLSVAFAEAEEHRAKAAEDNTQLIGQVAILESNLRQRKEEIEQAWANAEELAAERDRIQERIAELQAGQDQLETKLAKSDGWVFDLAGERRILEGRLAKVQADLSHATRSISRMEAAAEVKQHQLQDQAIVNQRILTGLARLQGLELVPELLHSQTDRLHREWRDDEHPLAPLAGALHAVAGLALTLAAKKATLHESVEKLVERLEDREQNARDAEARISTLTETLSSVRTDALSYHSKAAQALEHLENLRAEHKQQTRTLRSLEDRAARKDRDFNWLRRFYQILERDELGWTGYLPPSIRRHRIAKALQNNGMFDANAYLERYADVADAGMDPLRHYVLHGMAEGRDLEHKP